MKDKGRTRERDKKRKEREKRERKKATAITVCGDQQTRKEFLLNFCSASGKALRIRATVVSFGVETTPSQHHALPSFSPRSITHERAIDSTKPPQQSKKRATALEELKMATKLKK